MDVGWFSVGRFDYNGALIEITAFRLDSKSCKGFFLTNKISTNAMRDLEFLTGYVTFKLRYN